MRSESHFQANIGKACRALKRLDRNQRVKDRQPGKRRARSRSLRSNRPCPPCFEGHAACSVEGQDDRAAGDPSIPVAGSAVRMIVKVPVIEPSGTW
jgi:hypothetical protein